MAQASGPACISSIELRDVDRYASICPTGPSTITVSPGRVFAIPEPGTGVTFSASVAEGAPAVPDVTVVRDHDGEVAVTVGVRGNTEKQEFGSSKVLDEFERSARGAEPVHTEIAPLSSSNPKCDLDPYSVNSWRWPVGSTYAWHFKSSLVGGQSAMAAGLTAMADGLGACGANIPNSAKHSYKGVTATASTVRSTNTCGPTDSTNVLEFGGLPAGVLAATCTYKTTSEIFAADVRFNSLYSWHTSSSTTGCSGKYDLQGVATHESGHVFGLNHVGQSSLQVMKPASAMCESSQRRLGPGDLRGMKVMFP